MTHLKIEQNTTGIEEVSHSIIEKLYNLAISGDLDASSNLQGRLHTSATYRSYVDYLTTNYPNLYITSSDYYVNFADPEVRRIFAQSNYGDGFGLLLSTAQTITNLNNVTISGTGNQFKNNTTIEHFNELGQFTSVTSIPQECFKDCTNLTEVVLPSTCTTIRDYAFRDCSSLTSIDLSGVTQIDAYAFTGCSSLQIDASVLSGLQNIGQHAFEGCVNLTGILNLPAITHISYDTFKNTGVSKIYCNNCTSADGFCGNCQNLSRVELRSYNAYFNVPQSLGTHCTIILGDPTGISKIDSNTNQTYVILNGTAVATLYQCYGAHTNFKLYVPDALLQSYTSDSNWSQISNHIYPLSNWVDPEVQS